MEKTNSRDGTAIAFEKRGSGTPLILVGGALSDRGAALPLASLLAANFTAVAYDRRGRGDSGDAPVYSVEREVEDLAALIAACGGSAFVYGHSSGAALGLEAAARGLPISRLALYEPPFIVDSGREAIPAGFTAQLADLLAAGRPGEAVRQFLIQAVQVPEAAVAQMRASPMWPRMEKMAHSLLYDQAVMEGRMSGMAIAKGQWASVGMPTLVLEGGASPAWIRNAAASLAAALPRGQHRSLEGQAHSADPGVLVPVLEAFFAATL